MASAEFIGLAVRVTLQSGIVISGVVATVEQASQTLTLRDGGKERVENAGCVLTLPIPCLTL
jgi:hypothetical protein